MNKNLVEVSEFPRKIPATVKSLIDEIKEITLQMEETEDSFKRNSLRIKRRCRAEEAVRIYYRMYGGFDDITYYVKNILFKIFQLAELDSDDLRKFIYNLRSNDVHYSITDH